MGDVLLWFSVLTVVAVAATLAVAWVVRRQLERTNRVARAIPTGAPVRWLWTPSGPARLHRRLQQAIAPVDPDGANHAAPKAVGTDILRRDLTREAARVDEWLVWADRIRPRSARRAHLRAAGAEVRAVEGLAHRLLDRAGPPPSPPVSEELRHLAERIAVLEEARREVDHPQRAHDPDTSTSTSSAALARPSSIAEPASSRPAPRSSA